MNMNFFWQNLRHLTIDKLRSEYKQMKLKEFNFMPIPEAPTEEDDEINLPSLE